MVTEKWFIFASRMLWITLLRYRRYSIRKNTLLLIQWSVIVNQSLQWKLIVYLLKRELVFNSIHFIEELPSSFIWIVKWLSIFLNVWNLFFNLIHFRFGILIFWYKNYLNPFCNGITDTSVLQQKRRSEKKFS